MLSSDHPQRYSFKSLISFFWRFKKVKISNRRKSDHFRHNVQTTGFQPVNFILATIYGELRLEPRYWSNSILQWIGLEAEARTFRDL